MMQDINNDFGKVLKVEGLCLMVYTVPDEQGIDRQVKYATYTVIGKNRTWDAFMLHSDFVKLNPDTEITDGNC